MLQQLRKAQREQSGFTLVEMLVVIVILGILAGVTVFAVSGIQDRGEESACKADVQTISIAAEAFQAKNGRYAASVKELVTNGLLRSPPSSAHHVTYRRSLDKQSVTISSSQCPTGSAAGAATLKYCRTLSQAVTRYHGLDLATLDDEGYGGLMATFGRLTRTASVPIAADWQTVAAAFGTAHELLRGAGLHWADLGLLNAGGIPRGWSATRAEALRLELAETMSSGAFITAGTELSRHATDVCGTDLSG